MKGLMFYDAHLKYLHHHCNICGREITELKAWIYREGDIILFFCGDTHRCRDEFLELNSLRDVENDE